ncbi:MAG: hypothetical protein ABIJ09_04765 [Pseudomonadota bacterium]
MMCPRRYLHNLRSLLLALPLLLVVGGGACPDEQNKDAGPTPPNNSCISDSQCQSGESCVVGLCLRKCSVHDVCDVGQFCSSNGFCEVGCRSKADCAEGKLCARGSCIDSSGACTTKADCPSGLVCINQICDDPPTVCAGPEDCPDNQLCNGFTQVCFDPAPAGCNNATDCVGRQGCESGCTCNAQHECVTGVACTLGTELQDCGIGGICNQTTCIAQPGCTAQADCDAYGLYCNTQNRICERTSQCTTSTDCASQAPATFCNLTANPHRCEVPTCLNGGVTCTPPDECSTQGRCVPPAGQSCASNLECCPDDVDNNQTCAVGLSEYCDIPSGQLSGACRQGCRDDSDCNIGAGESCNALHQCSTSSSGTGGDGEPCQDQAECRANYFCGVFTRVCYEMCETEGTVCPETGKTCTVIIGVPLCAGTGGLPSFDAGMGFDVN